MGIASTHGAILTNQSGSVLTPLTSFVWQPDPDPACPACNHDSFSIAWSYSCYTTASPPTQTDNSSCGLPQPTTYDCPPQTCLNNGLCDSGTNKCICSADPETAALYSDRCQAKGYFSTFTYTNPSSNDQIRLGSSINLNFQFEGPPALFSVTIQSSDRILYTFDSVALGGLRSGHLLNTIPVVIPLNLELTRTASFKIFVESAPDISRPSSSASFYTLSWTLGAPNPAKCPDVECGPTQFTQVYQCTQSFLSPNQVTVSDATCTNAGLGTKPAAFIGVCSPSAFAVCVAGTCLSNNTCSCPPTYFRLRCASPNYFPSLLLTMNGLPMPNFVPVDSTILLNTLLADGRIVPLNIDLVAYPNATRYFNSEPTVLQSLRTGYLPNSSSDISLRLPLIPYSNVMIRVTAVSYSALSIVSNPFSIFVYKWRYGQYIPLACPLAQCGPLEQISSPYCAAVIEEGVNEIPQEDRTRCYTASNPNPPRTLTNTCPTVSCGRHGTCSTDLSRCICQEPFSGIQCDQAIYPTNLLLFRGDALPLDFNPLQTYQFVEIAAQEILLSWTNPTTPTKSLQLDFFPSPNSPPSQVTTLATGIPPTTSSYRLVLPSHLSTSLGGSTIRLSVSDSAFYSWTQDFALISFQWVTGQWSKCSTTSCAPGVRIRTVTCMTSSGDAMENKRCPVATRPTLTEACSPSGCMGVAYCDESMDECKCIAGTFGEFCQGMASCTEQPTKVPSPVNPDTTIEKLLPLCVNGGAIAADSPNGCKTTCNCVNGWESKTGSGTTTNPGCDLCSLTCEEYTQVNPVINPDDSTKVVKSGKHDPHCSQCMCNRGYFGPTCNCRQLYLTIPFSTYPLSFKSSSSQIALNVTSRVETAKEFEAQTAFLSDLATYLRLTLHFDQLTPDFWIIRTNSLWITFAIGLDCAGDPGASSVRLSNKKNNSQPQQQQGQLPRRQYIQGLEDLTSIVPHPTILSIDSSPFIPLTSPTPLSSQGVYETLLKFFSLGNQQIPQTPLIPSTLPFVLSPNLLSFSSNVFHPSCTSSDFTLSSKFACSSASSISPFSENLDTPSDPPSKDDGSKSSQIPTSTYILLVCVIILIVAIIVLTFLLCYSYRLLCFAKVVGSNRRVAEMTTTRGGRKTEPPLPLPINNNKNTNIKSTGRSQSRAKSVSRNVTEPSTQRESIGRRSTSRQNRTSSRRG